MIAEFWRDGCKYGEAEVKSVDFATKSIDFHHPLPFLVLPDDGIKFDGTLEHVTGGNQMQGLTRR